MNALLLIKNKISAYSRLIRFDKPIGTFLLLWPTLWALWIASEGSPPLKLLFIFVTGTFLMRSAGCAINDFADAKLDGQVQRTNARPIVKGEVSRLEAFIIFAIFSLMAFSLVLMTNLLTIMIACCAVLFVFIYPFMKRFTHLPQVVLSIAFAFGIPMAFAATTNSIPPIAWLIFFTTSLWVIVYDTFYAMADREDDLLAGIKSTAILFGRYDRLITTATQAIIISLFVLIGVLSSFAWFYYLSVLAASILFFYQQLLIKDRIPQKCFKAFLNNQWVGFVIFLGIFLSF